MKIKRIQVKNIGPYVNENAFDFDVSDITKRMVLIGGKNGAGKTTLFNAIKICLYGCVAYGFESNNAKYFAEIEKIINANEKLQKIGEAEVVIDLLMDDGKYDHTYTFVRSWRVAGKKIAETFTVYKDGETLSETRVILRAIFYRHCPPISSASTSLTAKKSVISCSTAAKTPTLRMRF